MDTFNIQATFETRVLEKTTASIDAKSNEYFDLHQKTRFCEEKIAELDFQYRDYCNASSSKRIGRNFLLFVLLPTVAFFDYSSISSFITYLMFSAGSLVGWFIGLIGWLFFVLLELATGWVIIYYAKDKPLIKILAILLAIGLIITPSYLIYTTYDITVNKTDALYHKTIALIIVSLIIHTIFFLVISEVWAAIFFAVYAVKRKLLLLKDPRNKMKLIKKALQDNYTVFSRYTATMPPKQKASLLTNISWYIRSKITNSNNPYDLSDFNPAINYASAIAKDDTNTGTK
jgi:hypothetical protein